MKVTYLIGAGASANTIPVVTHMHKRMKEVTEYLKSIKENPDFHLEPQLQEDLEKIINEIGWLIEQAGTYYTIDTLAKKYYLNDDQFNSRRLKGALIIYFTIEQCLQIGIFDEQANGNLEKSGFKKRPSDKRYGNLIASLAHRKYTQVADFSLNHNVNIFSWNYDIQFELTLRQFSRSRIDINSVKSKFNILPNSSTVDLNEAPIFDQEFSLIKLNGNAIWHKATEPTEKDISIFDIDYDNDSLKGLTNDQINQNRLREILKEYEFGKEFFKPGVRDSKISLSLQLFNFAWESDTNYFDKYKGHSKNIEAAQKIAEDTEILVVVGYSFPIFNREIDARIIGKMEKLKKVYVQDMNPKKIESTMRNAFEILQAMQSVDKFGGPVILPAGIAMEEVNRDFIVKFQHEENLDQFVIPFELNLSQRR